MSPSLAGRDLAGVLGVVLVWGLGFTLTKPAVEHFPPFFLITACFALTAAVLAVAGRPGARPDMAALATLLCGGAAWAVGQSLIARFGQDADGAVLLKRVALHGAAQLAVATAVFETGQAQAAATATPGDWAGFAFIAAFAFAWAYVIWFRLLARYPVTAVTPFAMLMPVISVEFSAIMLGDRPSAVTLGGGVLIVAGVALASGVLRLRRGGAA
jgi:O-acetylserine/cysteine efflux transporter